MQCIYALINSVNNKCYIGQTTNLHQRKFNHKSDAYNKTTNRYKNKLYQGIRKYGLDNFYYMVVEVIDDNSILRDREKYWYDIFNPEYNEMDTSTTINNTKAIYQIDRDTLEIANEFESITKASKTLGIPHSEICYVLSEKYPKRISTGGYYWCKVKDYNNWKPPLKYRR